MRFARVALSVLLVGSCRQLPELIENECDNGVVEPGEDCDTFPKEGERKCSRTFCRYECNFLQPDSTPKCPEGRTCGRDNLCRMPDGSYSEAAGSPLAFEASELLIADVDGDQSADLIGGLPDRIDIRYGVGDGTFRESFSISIDAPRGERTLGDVNGDGIADILVPYLLGVDAFLGDRARRLIPNAHPQLELTDFVETSAVKDARFLVGRLSGSFGVVPAFGIWIDGTNLNVTFHRVRSEVVQVPSTGARFVGVEVDDFTEGPEADEVIAAIEGESKIWLGRLRCEENCSFADRGRPKGSIALSSISLGGLGSLVSAPIHIGDLDLDGKKDLMVMAESDDRELRAVVLAGTGSSFEPRHEPLFDGCLPDCWPLAVGAKNEPPLWVFPDFVGTSTAPGLPPTFVYLNGQASWTHAVVADFNGDGAVDVAASDGISPSVTFLFRAAGDAFNRIDVALPIAPGALAAGDYDGDAVFDLACVLRGEHDEIHVIFGEKSGPPSDAVFMARFPHIAVIQSAYFLSPAPWNPDRINDLIVLVADEPDQLPVRAAILVGTGRRRLHSPIPLLERERGFAAPHIARAADFIGPLGTPGSDLVALSLSGEAWFLRNVDRNRFEGLPPATWSSTASGGICNFRAKERPMSCADIEAGQIKRGDLYEAVLVDRSELCLGESGPIELGLLYVVGDELKCERLDDVASALEDRTALLDTTLADVDRDGFSDLILSFDGSPASVRIAFGNGETFGPMVEIEVEGRPRDVVAVGGSQLAILTSAGLFVATIANKTVQSFTPVVRREIDPNARLAAAQVNVDGLEDLVFSTGGRIYIFEAGEDFAGNHVTE